MGINQVPGSSSTHQLLKESTRLSGGPNLDETPHKNEVSLEAQASKECYWSQKNGEENEVDNFEMKWAIGKWRTQTRFRAEAGLCLSTSTGCFWGRVVDDALSVSALTHPQEPQLDHWLLVVTAEDKAVLLPQ